MPWFIFAMSTFSKIFLYYVHSLDSVILLKGSQGAGNAADASRAAYIRRRVFLEGVLGHYLRSQEEGALDSEDNIRVGASGKPYLERSSGHVFSSFNLSHSTDTSVVAVQSNGAIGVDIESLDCPRKPASMSAVMSHYFTEDERSYVLEGDVDAHRAGDLLNAGDGWNYTGNVRATNPTQTSTAPARNRLYRFLQLWTRKEAAVKALGLSVGSHGMLVNSLSEVWLEDYINNDNIASAETAASEIKTPIKAPANTKTAVCGTSLMLGARTNCIASIAVEASKRARLSQIQQIDARFLFSEKSG